MINRRHIREVAMQILYAYDIRKTDIQVIAKDILPEDITSKVKAKDFAYQLIDSVIAHRDEIDVLIRKHADNWELDRMAIVDRNLLRIAIAEMLYIDDVPPKVSINEAIEIAKKYSTDKSSKFVNGILDATLIELRKSDKILKQGRGLVDLPAKHPKEPVPSHSPMPQNSESPQTKFDTAVKQKPHTKKAHPATSKSNYSSDKKKSNPNERPNA